MKRGHLVAGGQTAALPFDAGHGVEPGRPVPSPKAAALGNEALRSPACVDPVSARVYVPLLFIARACGVDAYRLRTRYWPYHWGMPKHWREEISGSAQVNAAFLGDLVAELRTYNEPEAAEKLFDWSAQFTQAGTGSQQTSAVPAHDQSRGPWFREGSYA